MAIGSSPFFLTGGAGDVGYQIERSLRFNPGDSPYLSRTMSSASSTYTLSMWVKLGRLGAENRYLFSSGNKGIAFQASSDRLYIWQGSATVYADGVYRDPSAWYHIVFSVNSNSGNMYVNNSQVLTNGNSGSLDTTTNATSIGAYYGSGTRNYFFDGYIADVNFVDGQALSPTDFGEFDDNNVWQPIEYTGTYGTNGFHLDFSDNSSASALGTDSSGNGNNFTVNNISVTAGSNNDSLFDSPQNGAQTDTGAGGEVSGNYCTWNPLEVGSGLTLSNGNLNASVTSGWRSVLGTFNIDTDKWYYEFVLTGGKCQIGVCGNNTTRLNTYIQNDATAYVVQTNTGTFYTGSSGSVSSGFTWTAGDVIQIAYDGPNNKIWVGKNNSWYGNPAAGTGAISSSAGPGSSTRAMLPVVSLDNSSSGYVNFGQRAFTYTAPSGFKALCTANLDDPTIADGSTAMDVVTYTGNGAARTISGLSMSPDLVWIKSRSTTYFHFLVDIVRGANKEIYSNDSSSEQQPGPGSVSAFNSDGFDLTSRAGVNNLNTTYVGWAWDAGSSTVSNTDGSITSSVRANPSAGFSIVSWTGTGSAGTIGHGLNSAPEIIIGKNRGNSTYWMVGAAAVNDWSKVLLLNSTAALATNGNFNNTGPTSSVFSVGTGSGLNQNTYAHIAYCFAPVEGYSAFGSYTGNGSTNGAFVYTGFRPQWVLLKRTNTTGNWILLDNELNSYNTTGYFLVANSSNGTDTGGHVDFLSNGFKLRLNSPNFNGSGSNYIYAAFAENPFKTARAR